MFSESFLRKLETLTLATRGRAHGQLKGLHRSRRVGSGMVFADFRPYSEGDDIRIDAVLLMPGRLPRHLANIWHG